MNPETGGTQRTAARIDLAAITANVRRIREIVGAAEVMAVVKADGYGHGMAPAARAAKAGGASWIGVAFTEEALALRAAGIDGRLMCWLAAPGEALAETIAADVDVSASAPWMIDDIVAATAPGRCARVHLKIDTGLSRGGATAADWPDLVAAALKAEAAGVIRVVGLWSHVAHGDDPSNAVMAQQVKAFSEAVEFAEQAGVRPEVRHLANSGASLHAPATRFDLVRAGIATYGLAPAPRVADARSLGLRPAMSLTARLALTKKVTAGAGVSYGHLYHTSSETTLGLVPLGYGDGVARAAGNAAEVLVRGAGRTARVRIAGVVCMDQFVVDFHSTVDDVFAAGDEVVLFGPGDDGEPTAQEWADALHTISYEIVTRIGPRVPRIYSE